ncbi:MAG: methyltransferase [Deltaproteobacteria bacterium]|nr:methyltransferase [Deltaproteobacteria bacterium]
MGTSSETSEFAGQPQAGTGVEAILNYIAPSDEKPVYYAYEPPPGTPRTTGKFFAHVVPIRNAREIDGDLSLDRQGFQLVRHQTSVVDFYDQDEVRRVYYPEVESLLKAATGAEKVVIFDHQVRNIELAQRGEKNAREYGKAVHNDYTAKSGPRRVRDHLPPQEAAERLQHRFAEINVWRPIRGPIQSTPLALCDARSIEPKDFVPSDLIYRDKVGETYRFLHNPGHRWFYFPRLQKNEVILLKCYDSKEDGRARFTAHSAFEDPTSPPDAAPRESIEVRALLFWRAEEPDLSRG